MVRFHRHYLLLAAAAVYCGRTTAATSSTTTEDSTTSCGTTPVEDDFVVGGVTTVSHIVNQWLESYQDLCGIVIFNSATAMSSSADGASLFCDGTVDIGFMSRPWLPNEAADGGSFGYTCATSVSNDADKDIHRSAIQVVAAYDAMAIVVQSGGVADQCIQMFLGGGLTVDQLRYIYSSYTYAQLAATADWDGERAVPNPEANTSEKFWSELNPSCNRERIVKVGPGSFTGINQVFQTFIGIDHDSGESLLGSIQWLVAPRSDEIVGYVQGESNSIGYVENSFFSSNNDIGLDGSVKVSISSNSNSSNNLNNYVSPTVEAIAQQTYPLTFPVYMNVESTNSALNDKTRPFMEYGYGTQGTAEVAMLGFVPISTVERVEMLARLTPPALVSCFPADSMLYVEDKGPTLMKYVKIGDCVKVVDSSSNIDYSMVYSFGHFNEHIVASYLKVSWASNTNNESLLISPDHLVFVEGHGAIPASTVKVGDRLVSNGRVDTTIISIQSVTRAGAFAPFTKEGTLLVNGIRASSYITLQPNVSHLIVGGVQMTWLDMHTLAHLYQAPHRVICGTFLWLCQTETYTADGIFVCVTWPLKVVTWVLDQHAAVLTVVLLPLFVVCATAATVEGAANIIAFNSPFSVWIYVAATVLLIYYSIMQHRRRTSQK